jgi:D-alanine-D-alanine ligase
MIKVGVIRGGISKEYDASVSTGATILTHLRDVPLNTKYKAVDIFIDRDGLWHIGGIPTTMERVFHSVDIVFNALHGDFGQDGRLQQLLDQWHIPYTGSSAFASALGYNKELAKGEFDRLGIKTARHILFPAYQKDFDGPLEEYAQKKAKSVWEKLPPPWVVKPLTGSSSMGIHVCKTYPELVRAFQVGVNEHVSVIVEEMIEGKHATVAVADGFRGQKMYTFPAIEIRGLDSICPGNFSADEKRELEQLAVRIHHGLNLDHYSHSDFIVHPRKGIYALQVNTHPEISDESTTQTALSSIGASMPDFIAHIIEQARNKK